MKKLLTVIFTIVMLFAFSVSAYASTGSNGWNGGEKINFNPLNYNTVYSPSDGSKDLVNKYGLIWYENPTRYVLRGEAMLVELRTIQASLERRDCKLLSANGETLSNFYDKDTLVPSAQEEAKILKAIGMLTNSYSYMNMDSYVTRGEVAKYITITNQNVLSIPTRRTDMPFTDISYDSNKDYITYAYKIGVMDGITSVNFNPNSYITLEQMLDTLDNEVGYYGITSQDVATAMNETFKVTFNLDLKKIVAENTSYTLKKYDTAKINVNLYPFTDKELEFTVYDTSVCSITSSSQYSDYVVVKGLKEGSTYIKINYKDEPNVFTVVPIYVTTNEVAVTGITINSSLGINVNDNYYLTTNVYPYNATDKTVRYYSSNSDIAAVNSYGKVTGIRKGTAIITAETSNGYRAYCTITVSDPYSTVISATGINVSSNKVSLEVGNSYYITATVLPYDATNKSVVYFSDNSNIASVNSYGQITAVSQGTTIITAQTYNGYKAYCIVTVNNSVVVPTGITINSSLRLDVGNSYYLATNVTPYNATNKSVWYYSSDTSVATVDSSGKVTAISPGTATITAQTYNGFTDTCTITVSPNFVTVSGVTIESSVTLNAGNEYYLNASVSPINATYKTVTFSSNNSSVASVDSTGKVTAISKGTAVITVNTYNGYQASCVVTVNDSSINQNNKRSYMYVNGYEESSYYNAFNNESMTFIVSTNYSINSINLSNDNCYISQGTTSNDKGWQFTVQAKTMSQNSETLLTVTLSNGQQLTVRICIYP